MANLFSNFSMPSLSSAANWVHSLTSPPPVAPAPPQLFQTRTTHTPGEFADINARSPLWSIPGVQTAAGWLGINPPGSKSGQYVPGVNPVDVAMRSPGLSPQDRATLVQAFQPQGMGFMQMPTDITPAESTWKHEQLHDLYQKANLQQYASEIAKRVGPDMQDIVRNDPIYQEEMKKFGVTPIMADEGMAMDLATYANRAGGQSRPLLDYINSKLASDPKRQKQFQQLTANKQK